MLNKMSLKTERLETTDASIAIEEPLLVDDEPVKLPKKKRNIMQLLWSWVTNTYAASSFQDGIKSQHFCTISMGLEGFLCTHWRRSNRSEVLLMCLT